MTAYRRSPSPTPNLTFVPPSSIRTEERQYQPNPYAARIPTYSQQEPNQQQQRTMENTTVPVTGPIITAPPIAVKSSGPTQLSNLTAWWPSAWVPPSFLTPTSGLLSDVITAGSSTNTLLSLFVSTIGAHLIHKYLYKPRETTSNLMVIPFSASVTTPGGGGGGTFSVDLGFGPTASEQITGIVHPPLTFFTSSVKGKFLRISATLISEVSEVLTSSPLIVDIQVWVRKTMKRVLHLVPTTALLTRGETFEASMEISNLSVNLNDLIEIRLVVTAPAGISFSVGGSLCLQAHDEDSSTCRSGTREIVSFLPQALVDSLSCCSAIDRQPSSVSDKSTTRC